MLIEDFLFPGVRSKCNRNQNPKNMKYKMAFESVANVERTDYV